ncbi:MAG: DUF4221 family protein [Bacteroidota bacterium]
MKKSILIYIGVGTVATLLSIFIWLQLTSDSAPEHVFFRELRIDTFFVDHPSPILIQKYFETYTSEGGTEYFTTVNRNRTGIDVQPLNGDKYFTIELDSFSGPDSIKMSFDLLYCYKIVSWDSIFLINKAGSTIFMSDKEGNISTYWTVTDTICNGPYFKLRAYTFSELTYTQGNIYVGFNPFFNTQPEIFSCDAIAKIPLPPGGGNTKIERMLAPYPSVYTRSDDVYGVTGFQCSYTCTQSGSTPTFVASFPKDHDLYRVDEFGSADPIPARSDYIKRFAPFRGDFTNPVDNLRYESEQPRYWKVMYDSYRKLYYRIALHPQKFSDGAANRELYEKPWSIMVFDEKFEILGEQKFSAQQFFPIDMFVGKQGLYVSNARVRREGIPDRQLSFTLFEVKLPSI